MTLLHPGMGALFPKIVKYSGKGKNSGAVPSRVQDLGTKGTRWFVQSL